MLKRFVCDCSIPPSHMEISPGWHMCAICNLWFPLWISSYIQELLIVWLRSGEGGVEACLRRGQTQNLHHS